MLKWQGRQDSNLQPMVLETTTLPLSHSPRCKIYYIREELLSQLRGGNNLRIKNINIVKSVWKER